MEINSALEDEPEKVNEDAFGNGWLFKIKMKDESELDSLMDANSYEESAQNLIISLFIENQTS